MFTPSDDFLDIDFSNEISEEEESKSEEEDIDHPA